VSGASSPFRAKQTPGSGGEPDLLSSIEKCFRIIVSSKEDSGSKSFSSGPYDRRTLRVAISGIIAALYATMLVLFQYFSFGPLQIRVADSLMPLALVFGYNAAIGLSIGCLVGNYYGFATGMTVPFDVVGGAVANFVAAVLGYKLLGVFVARGRKGFAWVQMAILVENLAVTLIVGSYLAVLFPVASDLVSSAVFWYVGLFIGSLIAMNVIGYMVYRMTHVGLL